MARHDHVTDEVLRGELEQAYGFVRARQPTEAVHRLADAFIDLLRRRPALAAKTVPIRGGAMPIVARWPALGANLVPGSVRAGDPQIEYVRERFATSEALTYYEFLIDVADHAD